MTKRIFGMLLLTFLVLPVLACDGSFNVSWDDDYSYVTFSMTEAQVQEALESALESGVRPVLLNPVIQLRPGSIYIEGDLPRQNGDPVPGNLTVRPYVQNGELAAEITSVNFDGMNAGSDAIVRMNERLEEALQRAAAQRNSRSEYHEISVTSDQLSVTFRTPRER